MLDHRSNGLEEGGDIDVEGIFELPIIRGVINNAIFVTSMFELIRKMTLYVSLHRAIKVGDDDYGRLCLKKILDIKVNRSMVRRIRKARDPFCLINVIGGWTKLLGTSCVRHNKTFWL